MTGFVCDCAVTGKSSDGYTRRSDAIWSHSKCRLPSHQYLESQMTETGLNLMRFGPLHNMILSNADLMRGRHGEMTEQDTMVHAHGHRYRWTADTVTGSESGRVARVWEFKESQ